MGQIYNQIEKYLTPAPGSIFVEIGSDRYEGSTTQLDKLAGLHGTKLITVDISDNAQLRLQSSLVNTDFVISDGRSWAESYSGPSISLLYLDNFDYIYDTKVVESRIEEQKHAYAQMGMTMSNQNCQIAHLAQILALYNYIDKDAVIMFDDTYKIDDCWVGKCGPAVIYLLTKGWHIVKTTTDCGMIMKKFLKVS